MVLVVKNNIIIAYHQDEQMDILDKYYDNCIFKKVSNDFNVVVGNEYIKTLEDYRNEKRGEIQSAFYTAVSNGYYDQTLGITIRIADDDRNQFNQRITLINLIPNEMKPSTTTITDINGEPITLTLQEFFTLMLYMGMYYDSLWGKKATLDKQINDATTIEEINLIAW